MIVDLENKKLMNSPELGHPEARMVSSLRLFRFGMFGLVDNPLLAIVMFFQLFGQVIRDTGGVAFDGRLPSVTVLVASPLPPNLHP
jgi:hypothetical protein